MTSAYTPTRVTHRYHFYASHRLHSSALSEEENDLVYGKCNNPYGHGHNYILDVSIEGVPDLQTGLLYSRAGIDDVVQANVLKLFHHRNINKDVPEFEAMVPTTENLALMIARILDGAFGDLFPAAGPRFARVHVQETDRNGFDVLLRPPGAGPLTENVEESERALT
jgi:6-pyruvoyltetrahydropterin/6-carboxytetrahydropterin synthase